MRGNIIVGLFILCVLGGGLFLFKYATKIPEETTGELTQNVKLGKTHTATTDQGKVVVGDPKDSTGEIMKPQIELSKWSEEVKLKVNYDIDAKEVVSENNAIVWKGDKQDLIYKQIPAKKETAVKRIPKPKIKFAQSNNEIRYIKYGLTSLKTLAASYELFEKTDTSTPTITSFIPNEEGYLFFGTRKAEQDLKNIDVMPYPIVRVKTDNAFSCPVALSNNNGLFLVMYYAPDIERDGENIKNQFTKSINDVLKKHDVTTEIQRHGDFFYYMKDLQIKPLGRIAYDKNILIFNLYTKSPYTTGLKDYMRPTLQKIRDQYLLPTGGLTELNPNITPELVDEIIKEFADSKGQDIKLDTLNDLEKSTLDGLINIANNDDWKEKAMRSDIPHIGEEEKFDRFEFDILLHEKPEKNVFTYQIETDGLDFFYQPELAEEKKDAGENRPENVIGSYAVYKKNATNIHSNNIEAEKYKTGKVMHIYRPLIKDAKGVTTWGQLHIDTANKTLSVTVDNNWLKGASYPVLIDPTFGYTNVGASDYNVAGGSYSVIAAGVFTGTAGTATSISSYFSVNASSNTNYTYGLYKASDSTFVIGTSRSSLVSGNYAQWVTTDLTSNQAISAINYAITVWMASNKSATINMKYDSAGSSFGSTNYSDPGNPPVWPDPISWGSGTLKLSIYATYTSSSAIKTNLKGNLKLNGNIKLQ